MSPEFDSMHTPTLDDLQRMHRRAQKAEGQLQWVIPGGMPHRWDARDSGLAVSMLHGVECDYGREGFLANKVSVVLDILRLAREELQEISETSPAIKLITPIVDHMEIWRERMGLPPIPEKQEAT